MTTSSTTTELVTTVTTDDDAMRALDELAGYVDRRSDVFCTSSAWLSAAARHLPGRPVVIAVRSGGAPVAVAALHLSSRRGVRRIELLGGHLNDYGRLFHDDEAAADALADALVAWVGAQRRWSLTFGQLAADDRVLAALVRRLPCAVVEEGPPMPQIVGVGTDYKVSKNRRGQGRQALNRITKDGRAWEKVVVDDRASLDRWLPAVIDLRRDRDHASGRRSHLDDASVTAFYEAVVTDLVSRGRGAINVLTVDGEIAGYCLVMYDGGTHRVLDGRVADELQRYRGGMVTILMAVTKAAEDPGVHRFDWMRGTNEGKYGNAEHRRVELRAASHPIVTAMDTWEGAARRSLKAILPAAAVRRLARR